MEEGVLPEGCPHTWNGNITSSLGPAVHFLKISLLSLNLSVSLSSLSFSHVHDNYLLISLSYVCTHTFAYRSIHTYSIGSVLGEPALIHCGIVTALLSSLYIVLNTSSRISLFFTKALSSPFYTEEPEPRESSDLFAQNHSASKWQRLDSIKSLLQLPPHD